MDTELDFDPSQYTRLPPYLDNPTTLALGKQLVAASASLTAPSIKRSRQTLVKATQLMADAMVDTLGLESPASKRPVDLAADHSWSGVNLRLLGWLELPAQDYPEVAQAQAIHSKLFPDGLRFTQLEYGAQWVEADSRIAWLKQSGQLPVLEQLCGKPFVTELLRAHTAYGQMVGTDPKKRAQPAKRPDLAMLRKRVQQAILAHQIQLVAQRVSGDAEEQAAAQAALRPVDEYREKLTPSRAARPESPSPDAPVPSPAPSPT